MAQAEGTSVTSTAEQMLGTDMFRQKKKKKRREWSLNDEKELVSMVKIHGKVCNNVTCCYFYVWVCLFVCCLCCKKKQTNKKMKKNRIGI